MTICCQIVGFGTITSRLRVGNSFPFAIVELDVVDSAVPAAVAGLVSAWLM